MKPMLKAPRIKRLKLKYDAPVSIFAFNVNLRPYNLANLALESVPDSPRWRGLMVGWCGLTVSNPR